jgi:hypothetical protein
MGVFLQGIGSFLFSIPPFSENRARFLVMKRNLSTQAASAKRRSHFTASTPDFRVFSPKGERE